MLSGQIFVGPGLRGTSVTPQPPSKQKTDHVFIPVCCHRRVRPPASYRAHGRPHTFAGLATHAGRVGPFNALTNAEGTRQHEREYGCLICDHLPPCLFHFRCGHWYTYLASRIYEDD